MITYLEVWDYDSMCSVEIMRYRREDAMKKSGKFHLQLMRTKVRKGIPIVTRKPRMLKMLRKSNKNSRHLGSVLWRYMQASFVLAHYAISTPMLSMLERRAMVQRSREWTGRYFTSRRLLLDMSQIKHRSQWQGAMTLTDHNDMSQTRCMMMIPSLNKLSAISHDNNIWMRRFGLN